MIELGRRGFLFGLMAAPAIVRASSIMPVRPWSEDYLVEHAIYSIKWTGAYFFSVRNFRPEEVDVTPPGMVLLRRPEGAL